MILNHKILNKYKKERKSKRRKEKNLHRSNNQVNQKKEEVLIKISLKYHYKQDNLNPKKRKNQKYKKKVQ